MNETYKANNPMKNLEINIQEFAFLTGWAQTKASDYFKDKCKDLSLKYKKGMRLAIEKLSGSNVTCERLTMKAFDIREHYFKRYEKRLKLLNDKNCIEKQAWVGVNSAVKVFLKPEDVEKIEDNWRCKKGEFYSQQGLFGVVPVLVPKRKISSKRLKERKVANPN